MGTREGVDAGAHGRFGRRYHGGTPPPPPEVRCAKPKWPRLTRPVDALFRHYFDDEEARTYTAAPAPARSNGMTNAMGGNFLRDQLRRGYNGEEEPRPDDPRRGYFRRRGSPHRGPAPISAPGTRDHFILRPSSGPRDQRRQPSTRPLVLIRCWAFRKKGSERWEKQLLLDVSLRARLPVENEQDVERLLAV